MTTAIMTMIYATQLNLHRIQWRAFGSTDLWPNADDDDDGGALISTISLPACACDVVACPLLADQFMQFKLHFVVIVLESTGTGTGQSRGL